MAKTSRLLWIPLWAAVLLALTVLSHQVRKPVEPQVNPDKPPLIIAHYQVAPGPEVPKGTVWITVDDAEFDPVPVSYTGSILVPGVRHGQVVTMRYTQEVKAFTQIWITNQGYVVTPIRQMRRVGVETSVSYPVP